MSETSRIPFWLIPEDGVMTAERRVMAREALATRGRAELPLVETADRYRPNRSLLLTMNAALAAERPLLLCGDPGTGKTQAAWYLHRVFDIPIHPYVVRSTSSAQDLKWSFDAVGYLRSANFREEGKPVPTRDHFLDEGPLWRAFDEDGLSVVLIDEIDKAPRDFPNDLLQELDQHEFAHPFDPSPERHIRPKSGKPPIVVITSNGERKLPDAFLRRCIYHRIVLDEGLLQAAGEAHRGHRFPGLAREAIDAARKRFLELHKRSRNHSRSPGTAEYLVWLAVLDAAGVGREALEGTPLSALPHIDLLVKDPDDRRELG